jgi:hypothetical protein
MRLKKNKNMCAVTRRAIDDFNTLTEQAFFNKYSCKKNKYRKRVIKYGDPYMNAPLAKIGKFLNKIIRV